MITNNIRSGQWGWQQTIFPIAWQRVDTDTQVECVQLVSKVLDK